MADEDNFLEAVKKLRQTEVKRNFDQTIDLIINLKNFDVRKEAFNIFVQVPNKVKDKKIAAFFEKDSSLVDTIKSKDFPRYKEKKDIKKLVGSYDFFIASAKLMPAIATNFGRVLGPAGKMPNPQLGVIPTEEEKIVEAIVKKIRSTIKIRVKEPSIKIGIGKQSLNNEQIAENAIIAYNKIIENLPKGKDNLKDVLIKLSMDKPIKVM